MFTFNPRLMAGAALSAALLAGCGGDDHVANGGSAPPPGPVAQTITDVVAYINGLVGGDSAEPVDINALTLVADDGAEPAPLP